MALNDPLANVLSAVLNSERLGKSECVLATSSKLIKTVLDLLKRSNYIEDFKIIKDNKAGLLKITLQGSINKCGAIKPRFSVKKDNFEKYEKRYLLAKDFGILIVSTPKGIMTHYEAIEKGLGGRLIAYCY